MTNDDLKRFYPQNSAPQKREDFVRYEKNGKIPGVTNTELNYKGVWTAKDEIHVDDIVYLDLNNKTLRRFYMAKVAMPESTIPPDKDLDNWSEFLEIPIGMGVTGVIETIQYDNTTLAEHIDEILSYVNNENGGTLINVGMKIGDTSIIGARTTVTLSTVDNTITNVKATGQQIVAKNEFLWLTPAHLTMSDTGKKVNFTTVNDADNASMTNINISKVNNVKAATIQGQENSIETDKIIQIFFNNVDILNVNLEHLVINHHTA